MNQETTALPFDRDHGHEDAFGRTNLASRITHLLEINGKNEDGFVIGIEGEWGSGKTHLLNQVKGALEKLESKPVIIEFSPWIVSGSDALISSFVAQLAAAIGADRPDQIKNGVDIGRNLLGYLAALNKVAQPASLLIDPSGALFGLLGATGRAIDTTKASTKDISDILGKADLKM